MKFRLLLASAPLALAAGCSTTGTSAPTFNDVDAPTLTAVTTARKISTAALRAGKITLAQDQQWQAALTLVVQSTETARAISSSDPTKATAELTAAIASFASITTAQKEIK